MPTPVIMPKLGMTMDEGTVIKWFKQEGERVEMGQPLLEIMTDKVNMEVEAPATGVLQGIVALPEATVPVAQVLAYIVAPGEVVPASTPALVSRPPQEGGAHSSPTPARGGDFVSASPLARRLAKEAGLDLHLLRGSGPAGRIVEADVAAALAAKAQGTKTDLPPSVPLPAPKEVSPVTRASLPPGKLLPLAGRRKIIAERMAASALVPQFAIGLDIDMTQGEEARGVCSVTALLVRVIAEALTAHPFLNASFQPDGIYLNEQINIGIAVSADEGLVVPVIRQAHLKRLATLDRELRDLSERARTNKLTLDDVTGATFTVSNLGMFGIEEFKALINPPESAILAAGRITARPISSNGAVVTHPILHVVLSADHRVLDGATGSAFLMDVKRLLERPYGLL